MSPIYVHQISNSIVFVIVFTCVPVNWHKIEVIKIKTESTNLQNVCEITLQSGKSGDAVVLQCTILNCFHSRLL